MNFKKTPLVWGIPALIAGIILCVAVGGLAPGALQTALYLVGAIIIVAGLTALMLYLRFYRTTEDSSNDDDSPRLK